MTDAATTMNGNTGGGLATRNSGEAVRKSLKRRYAAEKRFQMYGILAIVFAICMPSFRTAMPAESYPRYSRRLRPSMRRSLACLPPTYAMMPHMVILDSIQVSPTGDSGGTYV